MGQDPAIPDGRIIVDHDMQSAEVHGIAGGSVAVFSSKKDSSNGPNQDTAAVLWLNGSAGVLAVADGAGGLPGGDRAARLAVEALSRAVEQGDEGQSLRSRILDGFEQANRAVLSLGIGAATTLAVAEISDGQLRSYHAGDSTVMVCGGHGKVKALTLAHAPVSYGVEAGMIDTEEALFHEDLNVVSNFVGSQDMRIEIGPVTQLSPRDTVVVASDGLFDNLHVPEVVDIVRKGPLLNTANSLADASKQRMVSEAQDQPSKPDDLTFLVYRQARKAKKNGVKKNGVKKNGAK